MRAMTIGTLTATILLLLSTVPAAAQEAMPATPPPAFDPGDYRIGADDVLTIDVFGVRDFGRKVRVLRDGTISLPLLGNFSVAGLRLEQAEELIARMLRDQRLVQDPQVTIFVEEFVSRGISVQGAVARPGVYQMLGRKTLIEMLGLAGGLLGKEGERAGDTILVMRRVGDGTQTRIDVDAHALMERGDPALNIDLEPGDVVMVPHERTLRVYVSGAVKEPGPVEFFGSEGISVLQAITAAGGPTERARLRKVTIIRLLPDGTEERLEVNLKAIRKGNAASVQLQNNDTIVINEFGF